MIAWRSRTTSAYRTQSGFLALPMTSFGFGIGDLLLLTRGSKKSESSNRCRNETFPASTNKAAKRMPNGFARVSNRTVGNYPVRGP